MRLRAESVRDDANLVALLQGPMVLAADLGSAGDPFDFQAPVPALVGATTADVVSSIGASTGTGSATQPPNLPLKPFFSQYDRRSAVYFPRLTEHQSRVAQAAAAAERARVAGLDARSVDIMRFGEPHSERDHALQDGKSEAVLYRGRNGRLARGGGSFEFRMRTSNEPLVLQATYWGKQRNSRFRILVDGVRVGEEALDGGGPVAFVERSYAVPVEVTKEKEFVVIRFEPEENAGAGPVFGCRVLPGTTLTA
jgi:hypothetical protein